MKRLVFGIGLAAVVVAVWFGTASRSGGQGAEDCTTANPRLWSIDATGDNQLNIADAVRILNFLFGGGARPAVCLAQAEGNLGNAEATSLRIEDATGGGSLFFGPTDNCAIRVGPRFPMGLNLTDPKGVRVINPEPAGPARLLFGPTDDCTIGIVPNLPGLTETDPTGFRLLGPGGQGCRLIFGPTMDCTVEVNPRGPVGLLLRDPRSIRIVPPRPEIPPTLMFGPDDLCMIQALTPDPAGGGGGLVLRDPRGIRISPPPLPPGTPPLPSRILFGPTDDCTIGVFPGLPGLTETDPSGFRLLGPGGQGCRLIFGQTMDCTIEVDPRGPQGLLLRDPRSIRILPPKETPPTIVFGPEDLCMIQALTPDPAGGGGGLVLRDPRGIRISPPPRLEELPSRLIFGPTDDCSIETNVNPEFPGGLLVTDPKGVFVNTTLFARDFVMVSTRRAKENIKPITGALEKIEKLQGVSFDWKPEYGGKEDLGFVAEEVAKVLPEAVRWQEDGKSAHGLDYSAIVAVAIEGVKEQQEEIKHLQAENAAFERKLAALQAQMAELSAQMAKMAK